MNKLMQFTKVTWLAGVWIALSKEQNFANSSPKTRVDRRKSPMAVWEAVSLDVEAKRNTFLEPALRSGFLSPTREGLEEELELFKKVAGERRGFMPHELIEVFFKGHKEGPGGREVSVSGKEEVRRIYNSGVYDYSPMLEDLPKDKDELDQMDPKLSESLKKHESLIEELRDPRYKTLRGRLKF